MSPFLLHLRSLDLDAAPPVPMTSVNLTTVFEPVGAWSIVHDSNCSNGRPVYSTTTESASITFQYTGEVSFAHISLPACVDTDLEDFSVSGVGGLSYGTIDLQLDGASSGQVFLSTNKIVTCGELFGIGDANTSTVHTAVLTLSTQGRFDVYDISYVPRDWLPLVV